MPPLFWRTEEAGFDVPIGVGILSAIKMPGSFLKMPGVPNFGTKW
jgi:hypothetical protein